ncbi:alpha/beta-hydrolase [Dichomitus squalens]|nr:alpha/beta-hydrolase [Dichomitus squalens]
MVSSRLHLLLGILLFCAAGTSVFAKSALKGMSQAMDLRRKQMERFQTLMAPAHTQAESLAKRDALITFKNPKAKEFYVDGTKIPEVKFDAGPSWSGLLPISGHANETRKLFFWFWPTNNASNVNDLLFWTNGGPGCSSLEGFLQENGPISWSWGQSEPTPNPWSWTNLSNVLWVEQPVGTGFSQGVPDISNDDELAAQVAGFMEQFLEVFSELKGSNFWVSGESYAGYYVPYIANYLYEHPNPHLHLKGIWISDPTISWFLVQSEIPALRFVQANENVFPFNSTVRTQLQNISDACGFTDYLDHVTYPPTGLLPLPRGAFLDPDGTVDFGDDCEINGLIQELVTEINPVFDIYRVTDTFPSPWSVLGFPQSTQKFIYFNRTDVQDAIHAPHIDWEICSEENVYVGFGDTSVPPAANNVLPNVIEKSERVAIVHGLADMILIAEGARIAIQNMTWNGKQGFQTPIEPESFIVDNMGVYGNYHTERNLTYVEFYYSGHQTPQFVPWAAYQTIAYVLGKRDSPSA